ncbi:MAG TPA: formate dehydrogenase subunit alpha [Streptosporangiaceae bacterium]|jgi:formate dehydrogenase major subunit|nr:formate dehydrogenase subunit alpha [Streptosporangiaceae bacterium]
MVIHAPAQARTVTLTIDGVGVTVAEGTTIWSAARDAGIDIPVLCHDERYDPVGVCRMCVVDVGARAYAAACVRPCEDGMDVKTATPDVERNRATLAELLLADQPARERDPKQTTTGDNELLALAERFGLPGPGEIPTAAGRGADLSNPVISVDHDACILCDRCVRACDDIQGNDVIGRSGKGYTTRIAFDLNDPMGASSCVTCGECVAACPTGALTNKPIRSIPIRPRSDLDAVDSVCPYCGVGCALTYHVDRERGAISFAEGRPQPGSQGRLCVKGRYGWDYAASPQRLTVPLIRRDEAYPKGALSADVLGQMNGPEGNRGGGIGAAAAGAGIRQPDGNGQDGGERRRRRRPGGLVNYDEVLPHFREATWDEALDLVARRLTEIHAAGGPGAIAGFGSAKCSNEEAYLFQKLIRTGFHTNNVDHCTRLCHASSVAALFEGIGSGAVSTTYGDVINADVAIVTGSNPTANHPVASSFFKQARRRGTTIIYVDPRADKMADHADIFCQLKPGTDVAFYNGVMHEVIRLGLTDTEFIENRTTNYAALAETVSHYPPDRAALICGVPAHVIRRVARAWGEAGAGVIFWGMGISQHTTGTDNARCLIAMCAITGNVGRPGSGLHPLRGQNNVQGASDMGLIPMFYPDYKKADDPDVRARFEQAWGAEDLDPERGLTVTEIIGSVLGGAAGGVKAVRGMYMLGENPFLSDPNINKVRKALSALEFLVVQDIFLTETAEFADVILPASSYLEKDGTYTNTDRRVQLGRKVLDPPGQARVDWEVVQDIANRIGLGWSYGSAREVFEEVVSVMPSYQNLSYDNLGRSGKLYPNADPDHSDGTVVMFGERFNTPDGLAHLVPAEWLPARELPDDEYPYVLNTGRLLEHWHTGSMTRRSYALDAISPRAEVYLHPDDAAGLGLADGEMARVSSRRGTIVLETRVSHREARGNCFIPFHFREAAANLLTIDEIDPFGKIPEFKFCAVRIEPANAPAPAGQAAPETAATRGVDSPAGDR